MSQEVVFVMVVGGYVLMIVVVELAIPQVVFTGVVILIVMVSSM